MTMASVLSMRKPLAGLLILTFVCLTVAWAPAQAAMVGTAQILNPKEDDQDRERLHGFLNRAEVREQLEAWGVDSEIAKAHIDCLTDEEVVEILGQLEELPAGGDAVGAIIGGAVLVFLVLLVTDILGLTDVFPFVKKHR
jgi:hypothetical protein